MTTKSSNNFRQTAGKDNVEQMSKQLKDTGGQTVRAVVIGQRHCSLNRTLTLSFVTEQEYAPRVSSHTTRQIATDTGIYRSSVAHITSFLNQAFCYIC